MTTNTGLDDENKQIDVSCNRKFDFHLIFRKFSFGKFQIFFQTSFLQLSKPRQRLFA